MKCISGPSTCRGVSRSIDMGIEVIRVHKLVKMRSLHWNIPHQLLLGGILETLDLDDTFDKFKDPDLQFRTS